MYTNICIYLHSHIHSVCEYIHLSSIFHWLVKAPCHFLFNEASEFAQQHLILVLASAAAIDGASLLAGVGTDSCENFWTMLELELMQGYVLYMPLHMHVYCKQIHIWVHAYKYKICISVCMCVSESSLTRCDLRRMSECVYVCIRKTQSVLHPHAGEEPGTKEIKELCKTQRDPSKLHLWQVLSQNFSKSRLALDFSFEMSHLAASWGFPQRVR